MVTSYYKNPHPVAYRDEILAPVPGWGMTPNLAGERIIGVGDADGLGSSDFASTAVKVAIGLGVVSFASVALLLGLSALTTFTAVAPSAVATKAFLGSKSKQATPNYRRNRARKNPAAAAVAKAAQFAIQYGPLIVEGSKKAYESAKPQIDALVAKYGPEFSAALETYVYSQLNKLKDKKTVEQASERLSEVKQVAVKNGRLLSRRR